ncbi:3-hydroxyacyl-CoA dehydrogenase NAD-binding domain-containing protein [Herbiconiux sp. KACC 21604]|uniref:3-hydroxyacyl-CoA dehydrogenase NAD-binding domain-containing protein n=1 Tax=unclassified Herbiconiux TaxID=2618217 RepID=UPI0014909A20|nr:3-hydroxyacyl-CoA dehydrogenase NAD-binding domain-containing protein [Herbiconiux sp. SALV-R1]QJU54752.1 3-hydroxyacyl-CoA dehydrogenase family protein [Herbiconiux sp. SALV-R1]WPO85859.1 3-hydroxyacyl-CoA dehydrogenase NAD-binding domain-containing protein [Herbiconiux sp. KACC 21604]
MSSLPTIATVIGSGTMGPGIAATLARAGATVRLYDISDDAIARAEAAYGVVQNVLEAVDSPSAPGGSVSFGTDLDAALEGTELVIEAVPEKLELKQQVLADLEARIGDEVIIASNTSGIPISTMAESMTLPGRLIGMHWSNPPHLIPMIEIIPGKATDEALVGKLTEIVKAFNYVPVLEKEIPGFVENRVLYAILRECMALLEEGIVTPEGLDACVKWGIGYKLSVIGPTRLLDMAGLDIYQAVSSYLNKDLDNSTDTPEFIKEKIAEGKLGFKSNGGMYEYGEGDVDAKRKEIITGLIAARKTLSSIPNV